MPKKTGLKKKSPPAKLPPLTPLERQIMADVMNNVAFENYQECCSVEDMAERFQRTPGRFLTTLKKLAAKGYLTIKGETLPWVYPTVAALRAQHKELSEAEARKIIKRIGG